MQIRRNLKADLKSHDMSKYFRGIIDFRQDISNELLI